MKKRVLFLFVSLVMVIVLLCSCNSSTGIPVLNNDNVSMTVGNSYQLTVNPSDTDIVWSSSNESVAKVDNGSIKAIAKGEATITAMNKNGQKASCTVKVSDVEVTSIRLNTSNASVKKKKSIQLSAKAYPEEANTVQLEWSSDDDSIASVDNNGRVFGKKKGTTIISCYAPNGKSASCSVEVTGKKKNTKSSSSQAPNVVVIKEDNLPKDSLLYCRASDWATLRATASRSGREIDKVLSRESVVYISSTTEFYYVAYQGKRGYVLKDYFSTDSSAPLNYGDN